jgi:hypothetical protein
MQKTILTALAATLIAASTAQIASASEHHRARKVTLHQWPSNSATPVTRSPKGPRPSATSSALVEKFVRRGDGQLEPATEGSTRPIAEVRTHAGIVKTRRFGFASEIEAVHLRDTVASVCCWRNNGKHLLLASISHFDPLAEVGD